MKQIFPKVWFATEQHFNSQARFINFNDRGSMSFEPGSLEFNGRKQVIKVKDIQSIDLTYAPVPWISLTLGFAALILWFGFLTSIYEPSRVFILSFLPFLFLYLVFMVLTQKTMLWIEVVFLDHESVLRRAYFSYGSGWGAIFGGTLGMYKKIKLTEGSAG
jgi:hypothetical protein